MYCDLLLSPLLLGVLDLLVNNIAGDDMGEYEAPSPEGVAAS